MTSQFITAKLLCKIMVTDSLQLAIFSESIHKEKKRFSKQLIVLSNFLYKINVFDYSLFSPES